MNLIIPEAVALIKRWETFVPKPYWDVTRWSIGYGEPANENDPEITEAQAHEKLMQRLEDFASMLDVYLRGYTLNDYQYGACLSLIYNRGPGRFRDSAVLFHIRNTGEKYHFVDAARAFVIRDDPKFSSLNTDATGKERLGLTARRITEAAMFLTPVQGT